MISFDEFLKQDEADKYNMLQECNAIIQQKESIIKEVREYILTCLEEIREEIMDELFEHRNYRRGNGSAEALHNKAFNVLKNHCINNSYSDLCEIWKD